MSDTGEVERLRARVSELETELETEKTPPAKPGGGARSAWWAVSSAVLLTLACILAPLSAAAVWAHTQVSDTEQYVQTVAPLADDPAVQQAVADDVTRAVLQYLDVKTFTTEALQNLAQQPNVPPRVAAALPALAVPITNGVESFTRTQVDKLVASPQFAAVWERVNRVAHEQLVTLLEGNQGGAVSAQGDTVTLNLAPIIAQVKQRLVAQGFTIAERIPTVDRSFVLVQSEAVTNAQSVYRLLNTLGVWLPLIALALFAGGVFLARDRRRALFRGALGVVGAVLVFGVLLALARVAYLDAVPSDVLPEEAAGNVFDTLVRFLRTGLRAVAVLGLVVVAGAFMTGPSAAAVRTRAYLSRGIGTARGGAEAAGWHAGRVDRWTFTHKRALRTSVVIAAGLVLVFWDRPTGWVVLLTALAVLLALAVIEFLGRPEQASAALTASAAGTGETPPQWPEEGPSGPGTEGATGAESEAEGAEQTLQLSERAPRQPQA